MKRASCCNSSSPSKKQELSSTVSTYLVVVAVDDDDMTRRLVNTTHNGYVLGSVIGHGSFGHVYHCNKTDKGQSTLRDPSTFACSKR